MRIVGIGVDIVEIERVQRLLRTRPSFRDRVFTPAEATYCDGKASPAECYAARWAAREAGRKALGGVRGSGGTTSASSGHAPGRRAWP